MSRYRTAIPCTCDLCGRDFTRGRIAEHFTFVHSQAKRPKARTQKKPPGVCDVCGLRMTKFERVAQHHFFAHPSGRSQVAAVVGLRRICDACDKPFSHYHWRTFHARKIAKRDTRPKTLPVCDDCGAPVRTLYGHWRSQHSVLTPDPKAFCDVCGRKVSCKIFQHWLSHHAETGSAFALQQEAKGSLPRTEPAACDICSLTLHDKGSLRAHWMSLHASEAERSFVREMRRRTKARGRQKRLRKVMHCDDCMKPFKGETRMGEHALRRHLNMDYRHEKLRERVCDSCEVKSKTTSRNFAIHCQAHANSRKNISRASVICDACKRKMFRNVFANHMKLVHGFDVSEKQKQKCPQNLTCDKCSMKGIKATLQSHVSKCDEKKPHLDF